MYDDVENPNEYEEYVLVQKSVLEMLRHVEWESILRYSHRFCSHHENPKGGDAKLQGR